MMKKHLLTALALMAVSGFAWAGSGKISFQDLDTNRDGQISLEEAKKAPDVSKRFVQADTNQDGKLDAAEFAALEIMPVPKETK
jgi:Ca2+-binding EF-hand superfamily protein